MEKIGIIGSGTWGTAIAVLLKNNGHEVTLWSAIPAEIEDMAKTRTHKNLPGVTLPDGIQGTVQNVNVLRQRVKVVVEVNDEKEIQEFPVNELKFRPRKKKVKVSEKEMKELEKLEDREGDKKSHGKKSAN